MVSLNMSIFFVCYFFVCMLIEVLKSMCPLFVGGNKVYIGVEYQDTYSRIAWRVCSLTQCEFLELGFVSWALAKTLRPKYRRTNIKSMNQPPLD